MFFFLNLEEEHYSWNLKAIIRVFLHLCLSFPQSTINPEYILWLSLMKISNYSVS